MFEVCNAYKRNPGRKHTLSFGQYHDPEYIGSIVGRVINEYRVIRAAGFGMKFGPVWMPVSAAAHPAPLARKPLASVETRHADSCSSR